MQLHNLKSKHGSRHKKTIYGRGVASGKGRAAGKGMKGQNVRKSGGVRLGFEGGQTPLFRRLPKVGFKNFNRKEYNVIDVTWLNKISSTTIDFDTLLASKMIGNKKLPLKFIGNGKVTKAYNVKGTKFTAGAKASIEAAGGTIEIVSLLTPNAEVILDNPQTFDQPQVTSKPHKVAGKKTSTPKSKTTKKAK